jgi:hypothetical protein
MSTRSRVTRGRVSFPKMSFLMPYLKQMRKETDPQRCTADLLKSLGDFFLNCTTWTAKKRNSRNSFNVVFVFAAFFRSCTWALGQLCKTIYNLCTGGVPLCMLQFPVDFSTGLIAAGLPPPHTPLPTQPVMLPHFPSHPFLTAFSVAPSL